MKQLLLPRKTPRMMDVNLRIFTNYVPDKKVVLRKGKHWKPCTSELVRMKKALDKLVPKYEEAQGFGMIIKAKRILKKATQISKRISILLGK